MLLETTCLSVPGVVPSMTIPPFSVLGCGVPAGRVGAPSAASGVVALVVVVVAALVDVLVVALVVVVVGTVKPEA